MRLGEEDEARELDMKPLVSTEDVKLGAVGLASGTLSGLLGISSGVVIVPALVMVLGWNQKLAQGTALAMLLPPVSVMAVWEYYKVGQVRIEPAVFMIACFIPGSYLGGNLAQVLPAAQLTKFFGAFAMLLAVEMIRPRRDPNESGKKDQQK
jgi:uncharacterized membrane protein YfcA